MDTDIQLTGGENVLYKTPVTKGKNSGEKGELTCATKRLVYEEDSGNSRLDISTDMISAIEYDSTSLFSNDYFITSMILSVASMLLYIIGQTTTGDIKEIIGIGFYIGLTAGVILFILAILSLSDELTVHTPSQSFVFTSSSSDGLENVLDTIQQSH